MSLVDLAKELLVIDNGQLVRATIDDLIVLYSILSHFYLFNIFADCLVKNRDHDNVHQGSEVVLSRLVAVELLLVRLKYSNRAAS